MLRVGIFIIDIAYACIRPPPIPVDQNYKLSLHISEYIL